MTVMLNDLRLHRQASRTQFSGTAPNWIGSLSTEGPRLFLSIRRIAAIAATSVIAGCGGGDSAAPAFAPEEVAPEIVPAFLGSEVLLSGNVYPPIDPPDGSSTARLERPTCDANGCSLPALGGRSATRLADLVSAAGFEFLETRRGVELGRIHFQGYEGADSRYGGWLDHSAFAIHAGVAEGDGTLSGHPGRESYFYSYSVGDAVNTAPVAGTASWTGVMVGADVSQSETTGNIVQGDASLAADFGAADVDVSFVDITDLTTRAPRADISWSNIPMNGGAFEADGIQGQFYGPDHDEVGGIFERDNILGAFGAARQN